MILYINIQLATQLQRFASYRCSYSYAKTVPQYRYRLALDPLYIAIRRYACSNYQLHLPTLATRILPLIVRSYLQYSELHGDDSRSRSQVPGSINSHCECLTSAPCPYQINTQLQLVVFIKRSIIQIILYMHTAM